MVGIRELVKQREALHPVGFAEFRQVFQLCLRVAGDIQNAREARDHRAGIGVEAGAGRVYQYRGKLIAVQVDILDQYLFFYEFEFVQTFCTISNCFLNGAWLPSQNFLCSCVIDVFYFPRL